MKMKGKSVVISGGGTGIGRATAKLLAAEGADVMIVGRRSTPLERTAQEINSIGGSAMYMQCDVSVADDVQRSTEAAIASFGRIDVLINNAAIFTGIGKTIVDVTEEEWDAVLSVNLKGVFLFSKFVVPHMMDCGGGSIVNCSSISGHLGQRKSGAYNASKGGIELLTKCMALDFAQYNIRVNSVCPAWVEIEYNRDVIRREDEMIRRLHPIGRAGQPEDVAPAFLYLASDDSAWTTGTSLMVDGGYTAQ